MSDLTDVSSIMQKSLLLMNVGNADYSNDKLNEIQTRLNNMPSVLDKNTLTDLVDGKYDISLKEYTSLNTYNTMMEALYGNNSANLFQQKLGLYSQSMETTLANAKSFIDKMKDNGMSNQAAVRTYAALQKYSLMSSAFDNYNFVNAKA